jgi:predicted transcriptional regulator YdeE
MNPQKTLKTSELQIVERPDMTVVGMRYHGPGMSPEIPQLWEQFGPRMETIEGSIHPMVSYGICANMDMQKREFDYLAAVEVEDSAPTPEGMERWNVPGGLHAMIPATLTTIGDAYQLAEQLIPDAGYARTGTLDYELYDERFDPADPESVLYICIPVAKK